MPEELRRDVRDLAVRTARLDHDPDPIAVAGHDGVFFGRRGRSLAGRGVAGRIALTGAARVPGSACRIVEDALGSMPVQDEVGLPGCGPVAFGALPFDPSADTELVIPEILVGRSEDGTRWVSTTGPASDEGCHDRMVDELLSVCADVSVPAAPIAVDLSVRSCRDSQDWCRSVADARDDLRAGLADKVVLAREVLVTTSSEISAMQTLDRLRSSYPGCILYSLLGFVGASPELLVARSGGIVRSHPMAGSTPRSADPSVDARLAAALLASTKDREEHRITIDMVHDTLLPWCSYLDEEADPSVVAVANVQHLATMVEGRLSSPPASVIELMTALHPTPAVCGFPREAALDLIRRHEHLDRGRYGGPVGWVDAAGNGEWAVGIRCAEIAGSTARLFAGVGVVADSDPLTELAETQTKLLAMLSAIIRP